MNDNGKAFLASSTWKGAKEGYYFGTTVEQGTGYYLDVNANNAATSTSTLIQQKEYSSNGNKRKRNITIDESQNKIQSIPSRFHDHGQRLTPEELLQQAEEEQRQGKYNTSNKIIELTARGVQSAVASLAKLHRVNALQRAQHASISDADIPSHDDPHPYLESELALHDQLQAFSGVATHPQFFSLLDLQLCVELLSHPNSDIATSLVHVWVEWLEVDSDSADDDRDQALEFISQLARSIVYHDSSTLLELMVANLGRLKFSGKSDDDVNDDDYHDDQGVEDILTCIEQLVEIVDTNPEENDRPDTKTIAEILAKDTTLVSWLVSQLPNRHARSAELLVLLVQQPTLHAFIADWTKLPAYASILTDDDEKELPDKDVSPTTVDALEVMLQSMAPYRKEQPGTPAEVDLLENVVLVLASLLVFASASDDKAKEEGENIFLFQFLKAQGPELIVRCLKERVHLGGVGLALLDLRHKHACEYLVGTVGILKYLFPLWMGQSIPKPATMSTTSLSKKARRLWLNKLEEHVIHIMYNLTRFLDDASPLDAKQRLLVQFLDQDRLDRLVELLLHYDDKARKSEYKFYRLAEDDDENDESVIAEALSAKLAGGGDLFHRLGAICAFVCVHSKKSHAHVLQQLTLQQSGVGLVKAALQEFMSIVEEEGDQKMQLLRYLEQL
jgi:beta-catenin-like protein 1